MKRHVIVNAMLSCLLRIGQSRNAKILVAIAAGYHLAVSIVCPNLDDIVRNMDMTRFIQFRDLPI